ncbi:winged helix-turn-helix domain-containing protein [Serratia ureilytica]|uniref:winged helix-turn-helix domain-containing protein n=1 Tax=Serratia ureilytica TaxID=300181 RepID=UPI002DB72E89|nr:winged helix-turn-helix domain-containing protein [Serratia ureilytica]MEB5996064.1 winged helix-turn-helix domain-containing protein [Serratia ureilytica]
MRYIINNNIKYHEDRSELVALDGDLPPQPLTATLNRLLSALVRNNNLVLSRETLLMQVWEAHGQVASGNNLNNTISILRRLFAAFGEDDIIVTLPRQGFMFTATTLKTMDSLAPPETVREAPEAQTTGGSGTRPRSAAGRTMARVKPLAMAALMVLALGLACWAWTEAEYDPVRALTVGNIGQCEVKFITSYYKVSPDMVDLTRLEALLKKNNNIQCNEPATLLYYDSRSVVEGNDRRFRNTYFYYCPQAKMAGANAQCENIHENQVF